MIIPVIYTTRFQPYCIYMALKHELLSCITFTGVIIHVACNIQCHFICKTVLGKVLKKINVSKIMYNHVK
jgi:hypothetical protein